MGPLPPTTRIGDFVIEGLLGTGGMGEVYRATQMRLGRPVALKVLSGGLGTDPVFAERFLREATIMRDLEHPSVVTVYDAGSDRGRLYLAMRLLESRTLKDLLAAGPLRPDRAMALLGPLADALDHAHRHGVVHRDIKPANILLDAAGRPYLADFGIAKAAENATVTRVGQTLGTPRYMAPEQADGVVGPRGDLYSFACIAFEMLTGSPPFPFDDAVALLYAHAMQPPPAATARNRALPYAVDPIFQRAMAKQAAERFGTAGELVAALGAALRSGTAPGAPTVTGVRTRVGRPEAPPPTPARRVRAGWGVAAVAGVVVLLGGGLTAVAVSVGGSSGGGGGGGGATATTAPSAVFPPPSLPEPDPPVAHGRLLFAPSLDGTGRGFLDSPGVTLNPASGAIHHSVGALELEAKTQGAYVYVQLDVDQGFTTYVADMELAVRPGTKAQQCWSLRWAVPDKLAWYWCVDTTDGTAQFRRWDGSFTPLGDPVTVPDLDTGRLVQVTVVVEDERLTMYLDGKEATAVTDTRVATAKSIPGLELSTERGTGLVRITGIRYWAPLDAGTPTPTTGS